jgi:hypothetical protein
LIWLILNTYKTGLPTAAIVLDQPEICCIYWVKQLGSRLPDTPAESNILEVGELDELQTFVGSKKTKSGCGLL